MKNSTASTPPIMAFLEIEVVDADSGVFVGDCLLNLTYLQEEYEEDVGYKEMRMTDSPYTIPVTASFDNQTFSYNITVHSEGYRPASWNIPNLEPGDEIKHTFHLEKISPTEVSVHITDKQNKPLANANCTVTIVSTDEKKSYKTDENGNIDFSAQMVNYQISVSKDGYYTKEKDIVVDHNLSQMDFNITLQEIPPQYTRAVYLTIKNKNDNPVEGAEVEVHSPEITVANTTNENGSVMFRLPSDDYTITISASGYETAEYPLWIDNEPTAFKDYFVITKSKFSFLDYWYLWIALIAVIVVVTIALARRK